LKLRALIFFLLVCAPLAAQTPDPQQQPQLPAAPVDPAEAGGTGVTPIRIGPVTLSGSAWAESIALAEDNRDDAAGMFRIRRARIGLAGNLTPRIGWNISGEFTAEPILRNAFIQIRFTDFVSLRMGQATPPSGLERGTSPLAIELIDRSIITNQMTSGLDSGLTFMSTQPIGNWLSYAVSVVNGTGFNRTDNNDAKDLVGRIAITPPQAEGLSIIGSGSAGEQPKGRRSQSGLGVEYDVPAFKIAVECLKQSVEYGPGSKGAFAMAAYRIRPRTVTPHFMMLELAARYVGFNDPASALGGQTAVPDEDGGGQTGTVHPLPAIQRELQAGANYYVNRNVRFMANVILPRDHRVAPFTTFLTRLQIVF
jgi:hypothetical protein